MGYFLDIFKHIFLTFGIDSIFVVEISELTSVPSTRIFITEIEFKLSLNST